MSELDIRPVAGMGAEVHGLDLDAIDEGVASQLTKALEAGEQGVEEAYAEPAPEPAKLKIEPESSDEEETELDTQELERTLREDLAHSRALLKALEEKLANADTELPLAKQSAKSSSRSGPW